MRGLIFYLVLLGSAVVVFGISLAILWTLHWSVLSCVVIVPVWISLLTLLVMVARVTFKRSDNQVPKAR